MNHRALVAFFAGVLATSCAQQEPATFAIEKHALPTAPPPPATSAEPAPKKSSGDISLGPSGETEEQRCVRTRSARVKEAKETILAFYKHVDELAPTLRFIKAHQCHFEDTHGSYLVERKKEARGTRVRVARGEVDDIVCDTAERPAGLTKDALRFYELLVATDESDVMHKTYPACDAIEKPSLRVTYADKAGQRAILTLPEE